MLLVDVRSGFQVCYRGELPALDGMRCAIDSKKGSKGFNGLLVDILAPTQAAL